MEGIPTSPVPYLTVGSASVCAAAHGWPRPIRGVQTLRASPSAEARKLDLISRHFLPLVSNDDDGGV